MASENVYIALIIKNNNIENISSYNDIILFFNETYPMNKLVIEKYLDAGSINDIDLILDNFINKYPSGKRVTISTSTSTITKCSQYFIKNNLDIISLSLTATSDILKTFNNVLTYAPFNQYASINNFMIYKDYQMKYIHVLYEQNTNNNLFFIDYLNQIQIQADLLNISVSVSFLEKGKYNYNIKEESMVIILALTNDLEYIYINPLFIKNFPKNSFLILTDENSNMTDIFKNIPSMVQTPTNINFTTLSKSVYDAVKNNPNGFDYSVYPLYDILFVLNDFTTNMLEITKENYISINPYGSSPPAWILNSYLSSSISGSLYGKYQYTFTKNVIIGNDIKLFLKYYDGGQQQLPDSYSIFKFSGITPNNPSLIEYDESEYYKIYDNKDNLLCVRNNCDITNFPFIYNLNIGTTLETKFIYEYNDDGYFTLLHRLYPYNRIIPKVNSTMSKIPIKLIYNIPYKIPTYLDSKLCIEYLLSKSEFILLSELLTITNPNTSEYIELYNKMNDFLSKINSKYIIDIISSDGRYLYNNKLESLITINLPNQNICPEVFSSVNFIWGNPMINKTVFPIEPIYPDYLSSTVSEGYGISDRYNSIVLKNVQFMCKTWGGNNGPLNIAIFTLRVSQ